MKIFHSNISLTFWNEIITSDLIKKMPSHKLQEHLPYVPACR